MSVIVKRGDGDNPGESISDAVLTTDEALVERGLAEINENDSDRVIETGNIVGTDYMKPGSVVNVKQKNGAEYKGYLTSFVFSVNSSPFSLLSSLQVERIK